MARENVMASGIANHLAIVHSRVKIKEPAVAVSLNKNGIDFSATDGTNSHIVFLLLSPEKEDNLHLQLLAEIVNKFKNPEAAKNLTKLKNNDELLKTLKEL
jgi:mannitol/fructose-specific phosphotransferase system IIA component (Ntr-type)